MPTWLFVVLVILVIVFLVVAVSRGNGDWLDLLNVVDCCSVFSVLVLACVVMLSGLVLWHSLLLAVVAGASLLTLLLFGWASTWRKRFLATKKR